MPKVEAQYTKRYYKAVTKVVDVPDHVAPDDIEDWLLENSTELFEDEITQKSLSFEDDDVFIMEDLSEVKSEREVIIDKINAIIEKHGKFSVWDVDADHSPYVDVKGGVLSHLIEEFRVDDATARVYDSTSSQEEIDEYDLGYDDESIPLSQLEYILELAEKWVEYQDEGE